MRHLIWLGIITINLLNIPVLTAAPESNGEARVLHFPRNESVGQVYYSFWHQNPTSDADELVEYASPRNVMAWKRIGNAQGDVLVPRDAIIRLIIGEQVRGLMWLKALEPDDLFELEVNPILQQNQLKIDDQDVRHLAHLTGLTSLSLTHVNVSDGGLSFLRSMRDLKVLGIYSLQLGNNGLRTIGGLSQLKELRLGTGKWNDAGLKHLSRMRSLQRMGLSILTVKGPGLAVLEKLPALELVTAQVNDAQLSYFDECQSLREIQLSDAPISDRGLEILSNMPNLEAIDLKYNPYVTDRGLQQLKKLKKLKRFDIKISNTNRKENFITLAGIRHLTEIKTLEELGLPSQKISEEVLELIAGLPELKSFWGGIDTKRPLSDEALRHLTRLKKLETLHLNTQGITKNGVAILSEITSLKNLHLPNILDESPGCFAPLANLHHLEAFSGPRKSELTSTELNAFSHCTHLKMLHANELKPPAAEDPPLDFSRLTELDFVILPPVRDEDLASLKNCRKLTRLQIVPETSISDTGMAHLAGMDNLQMVIIGGPYVTDASLEFFKGKPRFSSLTLTGDLTNEGIQSLRELPSLWTVNITTNELIRDQTKALLARAHPNLYMMQFQTNPGLFRAVDTRSKPLSLRPVSNSKPLSNNEFEVKETESPSPTENAEVREERIIRFPKTHSVGQVYIAYEKEENLFPDHPLEGQLEQEWDWRRIGEAQGEVTIPAGAIVRLKFNYGTARDLTWLSQLKPNDLYEFEVEPFKENLKFKLGDGDVQHLKHLTGLTRLKLSYVNVSGRGLRFLSAMPKLKSLFLNSSQLGNDGLELICKLPELEHLHVSESLWNDEGASLLGNLSSLKYLSLRVDNINGSGLRKIAELPQLEIFSSGSSPLRDQHLQYLKNSKSIKQLLINHSQVTDAGLKLITEMQQLEHLKLTGVSTFTDNGLKDISKLKNLKRLNLSATNANRRSNLLTTTGIAHLTSIPELEHLRLPHYDIGDEVFEIAARLKNLRTLHIGRGFRHKLPPLSRSQLEHLLALKNLDILFIFDIKMDLKALDVVGQMTQLKSLAFAPVQDMKNEDLARLKNLTSLRTLNIPYRSGLTLSSLNHLQGMTEMRALYASVEMPLLSEETLDLSQMKKLETIIMPDIRDEDVACFANCTKLKSLQMGFGRTLSDEGMKHIAKLDRLQMLNIGGPDVTAKGLKYLENKPELYHLILRGSFSSSDLELFQSLTGLVRVDLFSMKVLKDQDKQRLFQHLPHVYFYKVENGTGQ
ncbi:MAG: leucine-rich repeat protein [Planctomycetaceae bacterium]|nr:leucine-rich repeat protein [Planctomycetaceae bacterium]